MKPVTKILSVLSVLGIGLPALACVRGQDRMVCLNDIVITPNAETARVTGLGAGQQAFVSVDGGYSIYSYEHRSLFLTEGCSRNICVGDSVTAPNGQPGMVAGLNPYNNRAAVELGDYRQIYLFGMDTLGMNRGCLMNYCVGDVVALPTRHRGRIVSINPWNATGAVRLDSNGVNYVRPLGTLQFLQPGGASTSMRSGNQNPRAFPVGFSYSIGSKTFVPNLTMTSTAPTGGIPAALPVDEPVTILKAIPVEDDEIPASFDTRPASRARTNVPLFGP